MKLPKGLTKPASLITVGVIGVLIILAIVGFWLNLKNPQTPSSAAVDTQPVASSPLDEPQQTAETTLDVENWKEYKDPSKKFMINFPQSWKVAFEQSPKYQDKMDIKLEGPEGWVDIMWADSYGGACQKEDGSSGYERIEIKSGEDKVCHLPNYNSPGGSTEYWQLQRPFKQNQPEGIYMNAYAYNKASGKEFTNREVLLKIIGALNLAP